MPYKIYTYEDPYKLDQTDFWDEISALPHFCVARTLVNGLKDVIKDSINGLICPLDDLVSHDGVYKSWTDNISLRVQQYSTLTAIYNRMLKSGEIDKSFHMALVQNQTQFLDAIRLFIELGISPTAIDNSKGNKEQRLFITILDELQTSNVFKFPETPSMEKLKDIIVDLSHSELKEFNEKKRGNQLDRLWYDRAIKNTEKKAFNSIVVHSVHQFSPPQLRLLLDMEKMGFTIIFLFNYQQKYKEIYSSWKYIYQCFDVPIHHDCNIKEYEMPTMQNPSNALAYALGEVCEGHYKFSDIRFKKWYQLYQSVQLMEFANITEYAHFISNHVDEAKKKCYEKQNVMDRGSNVISNAAILSGMDEQVYTANRDVHTLLKIYYPEYAKDRHFLAYPIGQFFSAIYRLWDYERGEIIIDVAAIKECLSSHILSAGTGEELLRTFYTLEILFDNITTFKEFKQQIETDYQKKYEKVVNAKPGDPVFPLRQLSIYNKYKITKSDIIKLILAINEINEIATYFFSFNNSHEDYISFGKHFHNLEDFLKQRELALANEEERTLIDALQLRLDKIKPGQSAFNGTFRDLREGLHYYLKQKNEDESVDWIVKNFEQIDGDILQSKRQFEHEEKKVYHFACISDRDFNRKIDDLLPWPLTDSFIRVAYSHIDLQFQVYYSSLGERSSFLRYALFYGLFYNRCETRLSYVKQYGDETTEPFTLLPILGLRPEAGIIENAKKSTPFSISINQDVTHGVRYDRFEMMDMFLCPYRFFLDYVMEDSPVVQGNFLYKKYYENIIINAVWKRIAGQPRELVIKYLDNVISQESEAVITYFSFWKHTEIYDLETRAKNYLMHVIIPCGNTANVPPYDESHMSMRKYFGKALFAIDITDTEPKNQYEAFEVLTQRQYPKKVYSLHKLPISDQQPSIKLQTDKLRDTAKQYLNQTFSKDKTAIPSEWCQYCTNRGICMESFADRINKI